MSLPGVDERVILDPSGVYDVPCDYTDEPAFGRHHFHATWVLRWKTCGCGNVTTRLICDLCHEAIMHGDLLLYCSGCEGILSMPVRQHIASLERI